MVVNWLAIPLLASLGVILGVAAVVGLSTMTDASSWGRQAWTGAALASVAGGGLFTVCVGLAYVVRGIF